MVVIGWGPHSRPGRAFLLLLFASTAVASVCLDHHWVLDALAGCVCTLVVHMVVRHTFRRSAGARWP
jgi:hypothetical protein